MCRRRAVHSRLPRREGTPISATDLTIPADLLPSDGRFGCGPSRIPETHLAAAFAMNPTVIGTSHRQSPVKDQVARLQRGLAEMYALPDGYEVLVTNGGATAFWDAMTFGLVQQRSQHYVFGEFSGKFAAAVESAPWLDAPLVIASEPGTRPALTSDPTADVHAYTHNETSTGVMMEIRAVDASPLVVVDGTSAAAGLWVDPTEFDVYYFSLQKGFASEGGLIVALVSPRAIERMRGIAASDRFVPAFFDLATVLDNSSKAQTYNTPSLTTVLLAAETTDWINAQGGLRWSAHASAAKADAIYGWADRSTFATPFVSDEHARSHVVATIDLDGVSADDVNAVLRSNGIVDTDSYRKLGRNQLRVGMFPVTPVEDVEAYTACVDWVVEQLG